MSKIFAVELDWHDVIFIEADSEDEAEEAIYADREHYFLAGQGSFEADAQEVDQGD